jgi:protein disulfide-isomerase A1
LAEESDVLDLTNNDFKSVITENDFVLVEFFAPWCGHCKSLAPEYEKAATELKKKGSQIKLAKVDCTKEEALAQEHGIQGFPTLKFFKKGVPAPYEGERSAAAIVAWVELKSGPVLKVLESTEAAQSHSKAKDVNVVGYFSSGESEAFTNAASTAAFEEYAPFGLVKDAAVANALGLADGEVKVYKKNAEVSVVLKDNVVLSDWLAENIFPLVDEINQKSYGRAQEAGLPIILVFYGDDDKESVTALSTEVATTHKKIVSFLIGQGSTFARNLGAMGASGEKFPTALALNLKTTSKPIAFDESTEFNKDSLVGFVEGVLAGTYEGNKKSEEIPAENSGPVTVVVGKTFNDIVLDSSKDVFVEFYAPWCGHCKNLAPIYEELAAKVASDKLVIAKIDATANWYPSNVDVQGYPTLYLFRASDKTPIDFSGERTVEGMEKFLKEKADTAFGAASAKEEL